MLLVILSEAIIDYFIVCYYFIIIGYFTIGHNYRLFY
jgi:hypothetical protein